ncbi:MAG: c-type cytochrome [Tepidimonas sp.]
MRLKAMMVAAAGAVVLSSPVYALDAAAAKAAAQKNACMGCHAVDKKLVGPSYKDVAAKYKGTNPAELAVSIKKGGAGKWGPVPMPAQAALSDNDAKLLAEWILAGAPDK